MVGTVSMIIILVVLLINMLIVRYTGHHVYTMIFGLGGFAFVYFYSFWYLEEMTVPVFVLAGFFFFQFIFGRIKHHIQQREAKQDTE